MAPDADSGRVRLAELVAALSLGIDLGFNQPMEHVLRQCLIALRVAERAGLDDATRSSVYYTALLVNVGCHSDAHEQAKWFGDDIELKGEKYVYGLHGLRGALATLRRVGSGADGSLARVRVGLGLAASGLRELDGMVTQHAALARGLAADLHLPEQTQHAIGSSYEQWDGRGWPGVLSGDEVPVAARVASMAEFVEVAHRVHGTESACAVVRRERGRQFDPGLADELLADADELLAGLDDVDTFAAVIASEPSLAVVLTDDEADAALLAIADFIDLKSPWSLGHGRAVAELAAHAAGALGLGDADVRRVRRAGLVHAFGKLGVSNAILDKRGPLGTGERERLHMIPYLTRRMLGHSPALAPLGAIAVQCAERLDGSGHPAGLPGPAIGREARVLGAADAYRSLCEPRPWRPPHPPTEAAGRLRDEARAGRLDADAVEAVLRAAGHRAGRRPAGPAGLTSREVEVLRLVALGMSVKEVAARLVISRKTVANHVEHIYAKTGCSNRAGAALFATKHGLLAAEEAVPTS
jgi:HD-GYP domain-containing protein (c-di-GMP phosphodiesterase class II)